MKNKLFTVFLIFSDHTNGIGQYTTNNPEDALREFIHSNESLIDYDRELLLKSTMSMIHVADNKGIWLFTFDPDLMEIDWPGDNPVLGGHIIQTDSEAPSRRKS